MTPASSLDAFIARAFGRSSPLCVAQFGDLAAEILVDDTARPQGFEHALINTDAAPQARFAIVVGDDPVLRRFVPERVDEIHLMRTPDVYAYWRPAPDHGFFAFTRRDQRGVCWFPDSSAPAWAIGQPCVSLLPAAIEGSGWVLAHAAAVGKDGRFLLMLGPGGAGKSTATLSCIRAGWDYAGDDYLLVNPQRGLVAPLYASVRIRAGIASAFQALVNEAFAVSDDNGAARFELRIPKVPHGGRVVALLSLDRKGQKDVTIGPGRPQDFLGTLLRESTARAPGSAPAAASGLLAVGRMAETFRVDTGVDPAAIPDAFARLLETFA